MLKVFFFAVVGLVFNNLPAPYSTGGDIIATGFALAMVVAMYEWVKEEAKARCPACDTRWEAHRAWQTKEAFERRDARRAALRKHGYNDTWGNGDAVR